MQHPALKELNVNNPQSIWGVGSLLTLLSSEGAEYEIEEFSLLMQR